MRAGELTRRVTIQNKTVVNTDGSPVVTWIDEATVWSKIHYLTGQETYRANEIQAEANVEITIRYRNGMTAKKRLICGNHIYNIKSVIEDDKRVWITMLCKEFAA